MIITEETLLNVILSVLKENRKVLKVNSAPSAPQSQMDIGGGMMPQGPMGQATPMQDNGLGMPGDMSGMDDGMGGDMNAPAGEANDMPNQFDSNFDAGVEADEETDPKHYIQQLTGKLSQSLNSFNSENGPDAGLSKYVASMIIAAACKNLDEKAKKELIEKINNASSDEEKPTDDDTMNDAPMDDGNGMQPMDNGGAQQELQEQIITKKQLMELAFGVGGERKCGSTIENKKKKKSIFNGKSLK